MNRETIIVFFVQLIKAGRKTIENVAPEYREEVEFMLGAELSWIQTSR